MVSWVIPRRERIVSQVQAHTSLASHCLHRERELHKMALTDGLAVKEYVTALCMSRLVASGMWHLRRMHHTMRVSMERLTPNTAGIVTENEGAGCTLKRNMEYRVIVHLTRARTLLSNMCLDMMYRWCNSL